METERLIIRERKPQDAEALFSILNSDFILQYNAMKKVSLDNLEKACSLKEERHLVLENKATDKVIGYIEIEDDELRYDVDSKALSYGIDEKSSRKGFMKEALHAVIKDLFEKNISIITVRVFEDNAASNALIKSLGFKKEGLLRHAVKGYQEVIHNDVLYSLSHEDYLNKKKIGVNMLSLRFYAWFMMVKKFWSKIELVKTGMVILYQEVMLR